MGDLMTNALQPAFDFMALALLFVAPVMALPTVSVYGDQTVHDMASIRRELLSKLDFEAGVFHSNATLWSTSHASYHIFATNRTEACHTHPRDTVAVTLWGEGAFRVTYSRPIVQKEGFEFVIPAGRAHAYGPAGVEPVVVSVLWSPPAGHWVDNKWQWASDVTLPATGC